MLRQQVRIGRGNHIVVIDPVAEREHQARADHVVADVVVVHRRAARGAVARRDAQRRADDPRRTIGKLVLLQRRRRADRGRRISDRRPHAGEQVVVRRPIDAGVAEQQHHAARGDELLEHRQFFGRRDRRRLGDDQYLDGLQHLFGDRAIGQDLMAGGFHRRLDLGHVGVIPRPAALVPVGDHVGVRGDASADTASNRAVRTAAIPGAATAHESL